MDKSVFTKDIKNLERTFYIIKRNYIISKKI